MFLGSLVTLLLAGSTLGSPLITRQQNTTTAANGTTNATSPSPSAGGNITASTVLLPAGNTSIPVVGYTNKAYNVSSYLGIPFASADRFRRPVVVDYAANATFSKGLNATKNGVACMQRFVQSPFSLSPSETDFIDVLVPVRERLWLMGRTPREVSGKIV